MPAPRELSDCQPPHRAAAGGLLVAGVLALMAIAVLAEPRGHNPLPAIARYAMTVALPSWHTTEPVNEVVYGTRGFDTFGETFLLLGAVVAVGTITRRKEPRRGFIGEELLGHNEQTQTDRGAAAGDGHQEAGVRRADRHEQGQDPGPATPDAEPLGRPAPEQADAMTVVVRGAVRVVSPLLLVAGIYLAAWGYSPGGGFPAGAVVLGIVLFTYVGYGYRKVRRIIRPGIVEPIELGGALLIVLTEAAGLVFKGSFSANFLPLGKLETLQSGGILQAFSGAELIEVATGLTLAVFGLLGMSHDWSPDGDGHDETETSS
jgi:multicomponent Na+:H+ antiporter subunit B